jgi:ATP/maltotriose-dependent transcriptional regulator MalT
MTRVSGDDWRVCIVAAGPGTGKTTFAAQWLAGTDGAWLSLDDAADHPEAFWLYVATALQRARPGAFDATEQLATRSRTDSALFVMQVLDDAAALERSLEFVLLDGEDRPRLVPDFESRRELATATKAVSGGCGSIEVGRRVFSPR